MKHAREDYNRIQDPAGKIPADEPVFLLRGQDSLACKAVDYYAHLCEMHQAPEIAAKARSHAQRMRAWPTRKIPDLPAGSDPAPEAKPIDTILHCPSCHTQHIDAPDADNEQTVQPLGVERWTNPPHRSHLCDGCGTIWRPADVCTNGVASIATRGKSDTWSPAC